MEVYKICPRRNNFLYPKEDKKQMVILYAFRSCDHQVPPSSPLRVVEMIAIDEGMTMFYVCCNPNCWHRGRDLNLCAQNLKLSMLVRMGLCYFTPGSKYDD